MVSVADWGWVSHLVAPLELGSPSWAGGHRASLGLLWHLWLSLWMWPLGLGPENLEGGQEERVKWSHHSGVEPLKEMVG